MHVVAITFDRSTSLYESVQEVRHYKRTKERNRKERGKKEEERKDEKERDRGGGGERWESRT